MKIKFIKEYVAVDPVPTSGIIHRYRVGETKEITPYTAQWLIDNGFAEEIKEPTWMRKQIKEVHGKNTYINYRVVKAFYLPVGEWTSEHKTAFRMEPGDVAGFAGYDKDVKGYINQMVKLGYIEVEDNPNIVWEDEND